MLNQLLTTSEFWEKIKVLGCRKALFFQTDVILLKDNVDEFHQGEMKLVKSGRNYKITSGHPGTNGDLPRAGTGYECYYYARFTSDRGANIANVFLGNARVGVFPRGTIPRTCIEI